MPDITPLLLLLFLFLFLLLLLLLLLLPVVDLEGVPWNPPFCRQLEDQPAHGTVFSQEI